MTQNARDSVIIVSCTCNTFNKGNNMFNGAQYSVINRRTVTQKSENISNKFKQTLIIDLCNKILNNKIVNNEILKTINELGNSNLPYFNKLTRSQIYAWVSVYACKNDGEFPKSIQNLNDFITTEFRLEDNINSIDTQKYFNEIVDDTHSNTKSWLMNGGLFNNQVYNLDDIRKSWANTTTYEKSLPIDKLKVEGDVSILNNIQEVSLVLEPSVVKPNIKGPPVNKEAPKDKEKKRITSILWSRYLPTFYGKHNPLDLDIDLIKVLDNDIVIAGLKVLITTAHVKGSRVEKIYNDLLNKSVFNLKQSKSILETVVDLAKNKDIGVKLSEIFQNAFEKTGVFDSGDFRNQTLKDILNLTPKNDHQINEIRECINCYSLQLKSTCVTNNDEDKNEEVKLAFVDLATRLNDLDHISLTGLNIITNGYKNLIQDLYNLSSAFMKDVVYGNSESVGLKSKAISLWEKYNNLNNNTNLIATYKESQKIDMFSPLDAEALESTIRTKTNLIVSKYSDNPEYVDNIPKESIDFINFITKSTLIKDSPEYMQDCMALLIKSNILVKIVENNALDNDTWNALFKACIGGGSEISKEVFDALIKSITNRDGEIITGAYAKYINKQSIAENAGSISTAKLKEELVDLVKNKPEYFYDVFNQICKNTKLLPPRSIVKISDFILEEGKGGVYTLLDYLFIAVGDTNSTNKEMLFSIFSQVLIGGFEQVFKELCIIGDPDKPNRFLEKLESGGSYGEIYDALIVNLNAVIKSNQNVLYPEHAHNYLLKVDNKTISPKLRDFFNAIKGPLGTIKQLASEK